MALMLLAGCTIERNGVVKHVIIGFGVVSVPKTNQVALVTRIQAVGLYAGTGVGPRCAIGYVNGITAQISDNATNILIETK